MLDTAVRAISGTRKRVASIDTGKFSVEADVRAFGEVGYIKLMIETCKEPVAVARTWSLQAVQYLLSLNNERNRSRKPSAMEKLESEMTAGQFVMTSIGIGITTDGIVDNGQHRLAEAAELGIALPAVVVFGLAPTSIFVTDIGPKRTLGDMIHIQGVSSLPLGAMGHLSSALYLVLAAKRGMVPIKVSGMTYREMVRDYKDRFTALDDTFSDAQAFYRAQRNFASIPGIMGAMFLIREVGNGKAQQFFDAIASGDKDPAIFHGKVVMEETYRSMRLMGRSVHKTIVCGTLLNMWNAWVLHTDITAPNRKKKLLQAQNKTLPAVERAL